jgi:hypothetical protein
MYSQHHQTPSTTLPTRHQRAGSYPPLPAAPATEENSYPVRRWLLRRWLLRQWLLRRWLLRRWPLRRWLHRRWVSLCLLPGADVAAAWCCGHGGTCRRHQAVCLRVDQQACWCCKKSTPKIGNLTAAKRRGHLNFLLSNDSLNSFSPQQKIAVPEGPASSGPVSGDDDQCGNML